MQKRQLGRTPLFVSPIGLGTVKFGRNQGVKYPQAFSLPSDQEILRLLDTARELGINLLDTAPAYGMSEERIGKLLTHTHDWVIASKVGEDFIDGISHFDFSEKAVNASVDKSLQRLRRDYIDILLVHSNGDDMRLITEGVFETLAELKQAGKIRSFGMSSKTVAGGMKTIELADVAMVTFNPQESADKEVIAYAHKLQKGILIKKAFASGHLVGADPISAAFKFIFNEKGVTSVIVGTLNAKHLAENVEAFVGWVKGSENPTF